MPLSRYFSEFMRRDFSERHDIAGIWVNAILALMGLAISCWALWITVLLQSQSNSLQKQAFVISENERNADRVREAIDFFSGQTSGVSARERAAMRLKEAFVEFLEVE